MNKHQLQALNEVLNYLWDNEERDFRAEGKPEQHIFRDLEILEEYFKKSNE